MGCENMMCLQQAKNGVTVLGVLKFHLLLPHLLGRAVA